MKCANCRHRYGEHDGFTLGMPRSDRRPGYVTRAEWTPRWGGACSNQNDSRYGNDALHTCPCPKFTPGSTE